MRIAVASLVFVGFAGIAWYVYRTEAATPVAEDVPAVITLTAHGFEPDFITVKKGTEVTFKTTAGRAYWPASNIHPDHTIYPEFDPKRPIRPDETWAFVFNKAGVWGFHDHVRSYFLGKIQVIP